MTMDGEAIFIDTNLLIYATSDESPFQNRSVELINRLMKDGIPCVISPQIIREYLVVFTRGLSPTDPARAAALSNIHKFLEAFILLEENQQTVARLSAIVADGKAGGKQIHDANIVAVMQVHGVKRLVTHNLDDFKAYAQWIDILDLDGEPW
ncbi:MAG: type II toxin-antitoxin system VapC family toxin [Deltaproteobacteria bacterium]|nr:type II toxin-antitoxin system VapC family toxin [Deltaproteobacteria bacterium]